MKDLDLENLELALSAECTEMASRRAWAKLAPRVRRRLWRPHFDVGARVALALGCGVWGFWEHGAWLVTAFLVLQGLPQDIRETRADYRRLRASGARDLFAAVARELEQRRQRMLLFLVVAPILVLVLAVLAAALPNPLVPLLLAGFVALKWPVTFFVLLPGNARELASVRPVEDPAPEEDPEEEPDGESESWPRLLAGLLVGYLAVFALYLGPPLVLVLGLIAWNASEPAAPLTLAVLLAVSSALVWLRLPSGEEDDA